METHKQFTDRIQASIIKSNADLPFDATAASYKEWIESLPILNTQLTSNRMSTASMAILSSNMNATDKFAFVETAQPCVLTLLSCCKKEIAEAKLPLTKKLSNISAETLSVLTNLQSIYMDIACSTAFSETDATDKDHDTLAFSTTKKSLIICRALEILSFIQLLSALIYKQPDRNFWNATHSLFSFAENLGATQDKHKTIDAEHLTSIENEFKKIQYFHLARTNRFKQIDITNIQQILALHAPDIAISPARDNASEYYVDLSSSTPIAHLSELKDTDHHYRFLSNENLIQFMLSNDAVAQKQHAAILLTPDKPTLPKKTIQQLLPSWRTTQSRQSPRQDEAEEVTVYPGFESIIRALILKQNPNYFNKEEGKKQFSNYHISDIQLIPLDSHEKNYIQRSDVDIIKALKTPAKNDISSTSIWDKKREINHGKKGEKMSAEINDTSLQGLRFKVANTNKPLLKATDLIAIQSKADSLQLAVIRRINNLDDGDVSVGIEMMSPNLQIAKIKSRNKENAPKLAIFLQGIPAIHQADSIISPFLLDNTLEDVTLECGNIKSKFSIEKIIESNPIFTHYTVLKKTKLDQGNKKNN